MSYHSNMTSKGQVTVPKRIRDALGLRPGQEVEFELDADGNARILKVDAVSERAREKADFLERVRRAGEIFRAGDRYPGMSTNEYMAMVREPIQPFEEEPPR
jgi:AbrB family looped-hinge helix DNA binding protein